MGRAQLFWRCIVAHSVEGGALVVQLLARLAHALLSCSAMANPCAREVKDVGVATYMHPLACAQSPEILCCLGDHVPIQAKSDFASALPIYLDVKEHLGHSQTTFEYQDRSGTREKPVSSSSPFAHF